MDFWEMQRIAYEVLFREAAAVDEQRWDDWLELFTEDCLYWVPAWKSDTEMVNNWKSELSLIFYKSRAGLEDRVWRIRSGQSAASDPPPRTTHLVSNVLTSQAEAGVAVSASFVTHLFHSKNKKEQVFFGRLEYLLVSKGEAWRIARRKTILLNDYIPAVLDVYCI